MCNGRNIKINLIFGQILEIGVFELISLQKRIHSVLCAPLTDLLTIAHDIL